MGRAFCLWIAFGYWYAGQADSGNWLLCTVIGFAFAVMAFDGLKQKER
jgi:hypothetical protein